jgi:hypothetical protein
MQGLIPIHGDRVQLQQVVLNLILNAVEAMSSDEVSARELSIGTERRETGGVLVECAILDRALIGNTSSEFSSRSTPQRPVELGWGYRCADPSSMRMAVACR